MLFRWHTSGKGHIIVSPLRDFLPTCTSSAKAWMHKPKTWKPTLTLFGVEPNLSTKHGCPTANTKGVVFKFEIGSSLWIRTTDPSVNSRSFYHWTNEELKSSKLNSQWELNPQVKGKSFGGPGGTWTPDQVIMSRLLWPTELRVQKKMDFKFPRS